MSCSVCGKPMSAGARFCGACGAAAAEPPAAPASATSPGSALATELCERLGVLSRGLRAAGTPAFITDAVDALARGPGTAGHLTAVVGERGRGKTTLVNRLLGAGVLPVGRSGYRTTLAVRRGERWQTLDDSGAAAPTALPVPPGLPLRGVAGPAAVLEVTTLLDTPPLNEVDVNFEERVVAELVHADAFLVVVAANQLLSQNERDLIRQRLLPLLGGDGAVVVTNMDRLETDDDRRDIRARAQRFAGQRLQALFLPENPDAPPDEVLGFIRQSAASRAGQLEHAWRRKVQALVRSIEQELAAEPEAQEPEPRPPSREERLGGLRRLLESEHSLALAEAESALRLRLGGIRLGLAARVAHWTPEYAQHEGVSEVAADVQTALREAAQLYVSALEGSLTSGVPRSVQVAAESVGTLAPELGDAAAALQEPNLAPMKRKRDLVVPLTAVAGIALLFVSAPVAPVLGVVALFTSHRMKGQREQEFLKQVRANAAAALSGWISSSEQEFLGHLRRAASPVLADLLSRLEAVIDAAPVQAPRSARQELLTAARTCLALAHESQRSPSTEVLP